MDNYIKGRGLYGDDFSLEQIEKWYEEESEGYANLGSKDISNYVYRYHEVNKMYGFSKLKKINHFENALGIGSAWGHEFEPIISKISKITIVEPSDNLISTKIGNLTPTYVKPNVDGSLIFNSGTFDLITCFGTLHHIPNVSFVLKEIIRVLKPNGYLLLREPIISMGDWRFPRQGLTKNERGIPLSFFEAIFKNESVEIISCLHCFTMTTFLQRLMGSLLKKPIYSYKLYLIVDRALSEIFKRNVKYHALNKISRIAPVSIYYVIRKLPS